MKKIMKMSMLVFMISMGIFFIEKGEAAYAGVTIVLDPGHDSTHSGASGNGVKEEVVNFKIAKYCKEELGNYNGINNIYMTRNGYECPYPGTTSTADNKKRVDYAKSVGADVYVSIHNNSASSSSAKGASVYYPNLNYKSDIGKNGEHLAKLVLSKLVELGLTDRGIHIRNSEDNSKYPDGSDADYYGVIKNSKLAGFTSIIIEHAFVSNSSDVSKYLSDDTKLKLLGVADAKAIAEYYGLSKKETWNQDVSAAKLTTSISDSNKKISLTVSGLSKAPEVKIAVWNSQKGQGNLKWYYAKKDSSGKWVCDISLSQLGDAGTYNAHVYAHDSNDIFACSGTFTLPSASISGMTTENVNFVNGSFDVKLNDVTSQKGIDNVRLAVWTKDDQSDLKWVTCSLTSNNNYTAKVNMADYAQITDEFHIHAYAQDKTGITSFLKSIDYKLEFPAGNVSAMIDENANCYEVSASAVEYEALVEDFRVAVWSIEDGQDDIEWYRMSKNKSGCEYVGNLTDHITSQGLALHVYAHLKNGNLVFVGSIKTESVSNTQINEIIPENFEQSKIKFSGTKATVIANKDDFVITATNEAVEATKNSLNVSESAVTLTGDFVYVTEDNVEIPEKLNVDADITQIIRLKETNYVMKDSAILYGSVKNLLKQDITDKDVNFFITDVKFAYDETKYVCKYNGKYQLQFVLPKQFYNKNIVIYKLSDDNDIKIEKKYNDVITANGYSKITADSEGTFVVAVLTDKVSYEPEYLYGDLDFNNKINLNDARLSLKASLGIINLSDKQKIVADYNKDGKVNLNDVKLILKKALGIK